MIKFLLILIFVFLSFNLSAQKISENEEAKSLAARSLDKMYNFEIVESVKLAEQLEQVIPGHPAPTFLRFLNFYWNSLPGNTEENETFYKYLKETLSRAEMLLKKDKNNEEGIFFAMAAHGYLSQHYAEEKNHFKALKEAKNAYSFMKEGFSRLEQNPEFYYTTGMYNYYREQFPESHQGYKAFMWIFASGDKEKGLKQLDKASKEALFTKTEATNYAANIYLRYEVAPSKAEKYAAKLVASYPGNHLYRSMYCETLINLAKYDEAKPHIDMLKSVNVPYFNFIGDVYHAIRLEKQENKYSEARKIYTKVIQNANTIPYKVDHYKSMAYCGLGRISHIEGKNDLAKDYFKQVLELAYYPSVRQQAETGLKKI
ncbi:MAG: hypothetical protein M3512_13585 [Bacteroidota bacterium]|nr:hypothetical protein [Bacteroidota bacterium]